MPPPTLALVLSDLLQDYLQACLDALHVDRTGRPEPDRVYVAHGAPSVELCPVNGLLAVYLDPRDAVRANAAPPNPRSPKTCSIAWAATLTAELWRCYPTTAHDGTAATASALDGFSTGMAIDGWCLLTQLAAEHFAGTLFDRVGCQEVTLAGLTTLPPQGNAAGVKTSVSVMISRGGPPLAAS